MTLDAQGSLGRLVKVGIVLGALGALSALLMAFLVRRLREQQMARFRSLVQNSNDLITVVGPASTIVYQSIASDRVLGRSSESLIGTRLEDLVHPDDRAIFELFVGALKAASGTTLETECRMRVLLGEWREMHVIGANLLGDRTVRGLVLTSRDVTERRMAERELTAIQAERTNLLDRTVEATEQERKRLAADLHDGPVLRVRGSRARRGLPGGRGLLLPHQGVAGEVRARHPCPGGWLQAGSGDPGSRGQAGGAAALDRPGRAFDRVHDSLTPVAVTRLGRYPVG